MEDGTSPGLPLSSGPGAAQEPAESSSQVTVTDENKDEQEGKGTQSGDNGGVGENLEESPGKPAQPAVAPANSSSEFKKTWGFRRTTIAKREMPGEAAPAVAEGPVRRSGRQAKRTDKLEEFLLTAKRGRGGGGRRSAPANMEAGDPPSQTPTDAETASEASFDGNVETKTSGSKTASPERKRRRRTTTPKRGRRRQTRSAKAKKEEEEEEEEEEGPSEDGGSSEDEAGDGGQHALKAPEKEEEEEKKKPDLASDVSIDAVATQDEQAHTEVEVKTEEAKTKKEGEEQKEEEESTKKSEETNTNRRPTRNPSRACKDSTPSKVCKEEDEEDEDESSSSSSDDGSSNDEGYDPNALYCICRQKHNKRFMICCDRCEEWFHGDCVGITEARGRLMERNGEDYICPNCNGSKANAPRPSASSSSSAATENGRRGTPTPKRSEQSPSTPSNLTAEEKAGDDLGIKGRIEKATNPSGKKKIKIFQPQPAATASSNLPKCIGPGCDRNAQPDSVYCGNDCILRHAAAAMKSITDVKEPKQKDKTKGPKKTGTKPTPKKTEKKAGGKSTDASEDDRNPDGKDAGSSDGEAASGGEDDEDAHAEEHPPPPAMSSWSSDHNYIAVTPEKTAPVAPSVLNKSCMYLFEGLSHLILIHHLSFLTGV